MISRFLICFLTVFVIACDGHAGSESHTRFVENRSPLWRRGEGWQISKQPSIQIGTQEGNPQYQFSSVVGALRLTDGRVVVGDRGTGEIRYYSAAGDFLKAASRKGGGPGEFKIIQWLGERSDSVFVWDPYSFRLTIFTPAGDLARIITVHGIEYTKVVGLMDDGSILFHDPFAGTAAKSPGEHTDSVRYIRVSTRDGGILGRVGPFLWGETFFARKGGLYLDRAIIFGRQGIIATGLHGFLTAASDSFAFIVRTPGGTPVRRFGRPHAAVKASREDISAAQAEFRADDGISKAFPAMRAVQEVQFANMPHRDTLPAISRILVDDEGNVWVEEFRIHPAEQATWSVFNAGGRWLGQVVTPAGLKVMQIAGGTVIGMTKDDLGVERVLVYPIIR